MIKIKYLIILFIILISNNSYSLEKILFEINNKSYTTIDLNSRIKYLKIINSSLENYDEIVDDFLSVIVFSLYSDERKIRVKNKTINEYYSKVSNDIISEDELKKQLYLDINRKKAIESIIKNNKVELNFKYDVNNIYNYRIKVFSTSQDNEQLIMDNSNLISNFEKIKLLFENKDINYQYSEKILKNIDKVDKKIKEKIKNRIFNFQVKNNGYISYFKIDLNFKDQLNPLLSFYRIETNQFLEEDDLYCQNLNSLSNNKNIKIKEYQDIDYSSLNNKIKESIKFINDFTILKKNDFILLCDIKIDKEKHNEILKNEIIEKKVEEISKNLISDYIIKYNYKKYE